MTRLLSVMVVVVAVMLAIAGVTAVMLSVPYFNQCDSRWSSDQLGGDGPTICGQGCALTSAAMVMAYYGVNTDPQKLNNAIGRGGYDADYRIYWSAVRNACHDETNQIEYSPGTVGFDTTVLNNHLNAGHPVIVDVGGHFVVVTGRSDGTYYINDPLWSTRSTLDDYPTRYGMRIFSGNPPIENTLIPLSGDLNGDGTDSYGTFDPSTAGFTFNGKTVNFGTSTDLPVMGDWDHDGKDEIGVYRPDDGGQSKFYLITRDWSSLSGPAGAADKTIPFGYYPDNIPIAGDWDGDGDDDIGGFNPGNNKFYLYILNLGTESATSYKDVPFGITGDEPIIGDWDGDGDDDVGVYREFDSNYSNNLVFYFDLDIGGDQADLTPIPLGNNGDVAVIGDWDDDGDDDVGLYRAGTFIIDPDFDVPHDLVYLDDGIVKVGVDLQWGGAISVIMHQGMNLIDNHDTGRLAQVAFYNDDSGTWDPVQGGDKFNQGSPVLDYNTGTNVIYTKTQPRDWNTSVLTDTYVEQWVSLEGQSVKVQYRFTHFGTDTYTFHDQEFPCAYINSRLYKLFTYTSSNPWTNDGVNEFSIPQTDPKTPNTEFYPTEYWASFVNDLGFGLTLYSPDHTSKWAAHRFTCDTKPGYLATVDQFTIVPGTVEEATEYFIVGNYPDARNIVYSLESSQPPTVITVDDDGPADYNNIQAAVDAASDGDTIEVRSGTYNENVDVNKRLILRGIDTGEGMPVVNGYCVGWGDGGVITLRANGCVLNGFEVMGSSGWDECAGIVVLSDDNMLTNNNVSNHYGGYGGYGGYGIHLEYSNNNTLTSNTANSNNDYGIYLYHSSNNTLTDNNASNNYWGGYGIYLEYSSNNTLSDNVMSGNTYNFGVRGDNLSEYVQNIDTSNKVDGKPIYYWVNRQDQQIPADAGYVGIVDCTHITVRDLILTNNCQGALFAYTENSRIENITASDSSDGIYLYSSSYNTLTSNTANSNGYGIHLKSSSDNTLSDNTASDNRDGIRLSHSSNNVLLNNTVKSNDWWYGIYLEYSNNNVLTDNNASNNGCGIYLESSSDNALSDNMMSENGNNFGVGGGSLSHYTQNIDTSNKVDGKTIYYWVDQQDQQIPADAGYVGIVDCTNIVVSDLTLTNNYQGALFAYTENSRIENVTASDNRDGIRLSHSSNNMLQNNTIASNNSYGIYLESSNDNTMRDNTVLNNWYGIFLHSSNDNMLIDNTALNNYQGICLSGSSNNAIESNTANSNSGCGIDISGSSNNMLQSNTANLNYYWGINLYYGSSNNTLSDNNASNNRAGIYLLHSSNNTIQNNIANSNNDDGIYIHSYMHSSNGNTVTGNIAANNEYGIRLYSYSLGSSNTIYHNNLIDNINHNAHDDGTSQWDSGTVGNYYSDYTGTDANGDGIGEAQSKKSVIF